MHGLPTSWEPSVATMKSPKGIYATAWSPGSQSIAISRGSHPPTVEILDAVTLMPLTTLELPMSVRKFSQWLIFSPDGHLLTWSGIGGEIITWDLQTGVIVSSIFAEQGKGVQPSSSVTYSTCGTMFGVLFHTPSGCTLNTYNALSGTHIYTHPVKGPVSRNIWTCGKCLQFATMGAGTVTMWKVGFVSTDAPTEVETHSIPDGFNSPHMFLFHPTLSQLALKKEKRICVWSIQDSKFLLDSTVSHSWGIFFSPGGQFLAYISRTPSSGQEIILWKESHTGYILHKRLPSNLEVTKPLISPDGGSIITVGSDAIQLWNTMDSSTLLPTNSQNRNHFIVEFSPDQVLVAIVRLEDEMVSVLNVKSGIPRLIINTSMGVYGLGITGSSIVVVGDGKIVTWNIQTGDHVLNLRVDITNSVQTVSFNHGQFNNNSGMPAALVSPNLHCIAIKDGDRDGYKDPSSLYLYDIPTGKHIGSVPVGEYDIPWFTLDGCGIWCGRKRWKITEDSESNITKLEYLGSQGEPGIFPWESPHSHQLVDNQWIFNSSRRQLLWLPPHWRLGQSNLLLDLRGWRIKEWEPRNRIWCGQFLALLHDELSEAVILELE